MEELFEYDRKINKDRTKRINSFEEYEELYKKNIRTFSIGQDQIINDEILIKKTSYDYPLTYDKGFLEENSILYINEDYFNNNKDQIISLISNTIENTKNREISIFNTDLITDEVIDAISKNENIETIELGYYKDYILNERNMNKLLENSNIKEIKTANLEDNILFNYNPRITCEKQCNMYDTCLYLKDIYDDKKNDLYLRISKDLTIKEIENIKNILSMVPNKTIKIDFQNKSKFYEIIENLKNNKIELGLDSNFTLEEYEYLAKYDNINFISGGQKHSPKKIFEREKIYNLIIEEVKNKDLSPLEQYMYLYNITKLFKEYKEAPDDQKVLSRNNEYTLFNEYMVCVGYATLLETLVKKLDNPFIKTTTFSTDVDNVGHRRCLTKINDEKYDIDGIYISDPTWDSVKYYDKEGKNISHVDFYNHMLMTKEEVNSDHHNYSTDITDIIFDKNFNFEKLERKYLIDMARYDLEYLFDTKLTEEQFKEKCQNMKQEEITGEIIIEAITNIYQEIYSNSKQDKIDDMVERTISNNNKMQGMAFSDNQNKFKK